METLGYLPKLNTNYSSIFAVHPFLPIIVSAEKDLKINIWDYSTNSLLFQFKGHTDWIFKIVFNLNGKYFLTCGLDCLIGFWDLENPSNNKLLTGHQGRIHDIIWDNSGTMFASCSDDQTIRIWQIDSSKDFITCFKILSPKTNSKFSNNNIVRSLVSHPFQPLFAASSNSTILIWNWNTCKHVCELYKIHKDDDTLLGGSIYITGNENYLISYSTLNVNNKYFSPKFNPPNYCLKFWNWPVYNNPSEPTRPTIYYKWFKSVDLFINSKLNLINNKLVFRHNLNYLRIIDLLQTEMVNDFQDIQLNNFDNLYGNTLEIIPNKNNLEIIFEKELNTLSYKSMFIWSPISLKETKGSLALASLFNRPAG